MYILFCGTNPKNGQQKEIKDLTFKSLITPLTFLEKFFPVRDKAFMTSTRTGVGEVLKFVTCLQILLFLNNRSIVHFVRWGPGGGGLWTS